jgi:hypothetical protein
VIFGLTPDVSRDVLLTTSSSSSTADVVVEVGLATEAAVVVAATVGAALRGVSIMMVPG